jgi:CHRD domain-containing protein
MMGRRKILMAAMIAVVGLMAFGGSALAGTILTATLTGAAEVDEEGNPNQGDPDGSGSARLDLMPNKEQICYRITVSNIRPATAAHIHKGAFDVRGPVVKELEAPSDGSTRGCVMLSRTKIMNIKNNPSGYYVNVHNKPFLDGAVRGQLHN